MMTHCHDGACHAHLAAEGLSPDAQFLLLWGFILGACLIVGLVATWIEAREETKSWERIQARRAAGLDPVTGDPVRGWDRFNRG